MDELRQRRQARFHPISLFRHFDFRARTLPSMMTTVRRPFPPLRKSGLYLVPFPGAVIFNAALSCKGVRPGVWASRSPGSTA